MIGSKALYATSLLATRTTAVRANIGICTLSGRFVATGLFLYPPLSVLAVNPKRDMSAPLHLQTV